MALNAPYLPPNPLRPWAFGGKRAEGMKKEIPSNNPNQGQSGIRCPLREMLFHPLQNRPSVINGS